MTGGLRSSSRCCLLSRSRKQGTKATVTIQTGDDGDPGQGDTVEMKPVFGRCGEEGCVSPGVGWGCGAKGGWRTQSRYSVGGVQPFGGWAGQEEPGEGVEPGGARQGPRRLLGPRTLRCPLHDSRGVLRGWLGEESLEVRGAMDQGWRITTDVTAFDVTGSPHRESVAGFREAGP